MQRLRWQVFLVLCTWIVFALAWTKEDHEIFRLRDEVEAAEGPDITFYDFIGVKPAATVEEINKAFRKKSKSIHPDKAKHNFVASKSIPKPKKSGEKKKPGVHVSKGPSQREIEKFVKKANERYSRLGVVASVLKGPQRARYDHFLQHGFPKWRGTGYYYSRYRPGFGTVLVGLFIVGGGVAHYYALQISYKRQRDFMNRYIRHARKTAWGSETGIAGIPGISGSVDTAPMSTAVEEPDPYANLNRRQKRELEKQNRKEKSKPTSKSSNGRITNPRESDQSISPQGERRRVTAENGKILLVDSVGNVFLEEEDEEGNVQEFLLDLDEIQKPTISDTAVVRLPIWLFRKAFDPFLKSTTPIPDDTVPKTDRETQTTYSPVVDTGNFTPDLSASQDFEIVDSASGLEEMSNASSAKKRGKKGRK